jgi:hypothetical protein
MSSANTLIDLDVKPTAVTYGAFTVTEEVTDKKDGSVSTRTTVKATMQEKQLEKAKTENTFLMEQTFSYDVPGTLKGIIEMEIPEEEKVNLFRQAITAKAGRVITSLMQELDEQGNPSFQPIEGSMDIRSYVAEVGNRRGLSDSEKALKTISGLTLPDDVMAMVRAALMGVGK